MFGLLIRLVILFAAIFGIFFGVTRALRSAQQRKALKKIEDDIKALKAGAAEGLYTKPEYDQLTRKIYEACEAQGIDVPDLDGPPTRK
jgi:hypothetical protein